MNSTLPIAMRVVLVLMSAVWAAARQPAQAIDCAKASSKTEKIICATPQLKKADDAMGAAYYALLRRTTDPDYHEALIRSQRRWLKDRSLGVPRFDGQEDDEPDDGK